MSDSKKSKTTKTIKSKKLSKEKQTQLENTQKLFQELNDIKIKLYEAQLKILSNSFNNYINQPEIDLFSITEKFNCDDFTYKSQHTDQAGIVASCCKLNIIFSSDITKIEYDLESECCDRGDFSSKTIKINNKYVYIKREHYGDYYDECFEECFDSNDSDDSDENNSDKSSQNINKLGKNELLIGYFNIANELLKKIN
jgi:hypothetical protein